MFTEKLIAVQQELKAPKSNYNDFGGFKYRSAEDILEAVKPILAKHGLLLNLSDQVQLIGDRYYTTAYATLTDGTDSITVTANAREEETKKGMDASQISGVASSYARKYALNGLFLIDDTKDADTNEYHNMTNEKASEPKKTLVAKKAQLKGLMSEEQWKQTIEKNGEPTTWTEEQVDKWISFMERSNNA